MSLFGSATLYKAIDSITIIPDGVGGVHEDRPLDASHYVYPTFKHLRHCCPGPLNYGVFTHYIVYINQCNEGVWGSSWREHGLVTVLAEPERNREPSEMGLGH